MTMLINTAKVAGYVGEKVSAMRRYIEEAASGRRRC